MIAAIYVRKSTEQSVSDDEKSVIQQIEQHRRGLTEIDGP